ncbi:MAG TPA: uroporphyrinogen decarboxylase family protein [bacterium]|nr:uroporphyrinogen decarboxylase family protein [bacterium]
MSFELPEDRTLVIPLLGAPGVKLSNTTLKENLTDKDIQLRTLKLLVEKFQPDGIFPFMDLTVEAEALGLDISFSENENPAVRDHSIKTEEDLESVRLRYRGISGRMPLFIKVVEGLAKDLSIVKGAYTIGPFTLAGELMGVGELSMNVILNPDLAHKFIEFTTSVIKDYAEALLDAGADVIVVLEPSAVMLSPKQFEEFSGRYFSSLVRELKSPLILHICGDTTHLLEKMSETGAIGLSLDSLVDLKEASRIVPDSIALIGNLDPVRVFLQSTPEEVAIATRNLLEKMRGVKKFILSSGCDLPVDTPLENIEAFMHAGRNSGVR